MTTQRRDALGDRMKRYEDITRYKLPPRTYTLLRVDGRAFHTFTRGLEKPYDTSFMTIMDSVAIKLCEEIAGAQFAYVQSDEISLLAVDFLEIGTQAWFDGLVQKWCSVAASVATMAFNSVLTAKTLLEMVASERDPNYPTSKICSKTPNATFDARVWTIPDHVEVENYFVWRQQDAVRNSVMMLARAHASHKQLHGKNQSAQHDIIHAAGDNWEKHPARFKHGGVIRRQAVDYLAPLSATHPAFIQLAEGKRVPLERSNWFMDEGTPVFTRERHYLRTMIPIHWEDDLVTRLTDNRKGTTA
jgi:tRNA(His) 5'-end guanylyltransferase